MRLHNFDLHAPNRNAAIFCLSLMGTNWLAFVGEVYHILQGAGKGETWVAEGVVENSMGKRRKP